jgi:hypothetical protein
MTSWSKLILQFINDGETHEMIINYFNHPAINEEYIAIVLDVQRRLTRERKKSDVKRRPRTSVAGDGTQLKIVYDYAMSLGGYKEFMKVVKKTSLVAIARELHVAPHIVCNFKRDFIKGRKKIQWLKDRARNLTMMIRSQQIKDGTYVNKKDRPKQYTVKDVRNLW